MILDDFVKLRTEAKAKKLRLNADNIIQLLIADKLNAIAFELDNEDIVTQLAFLVNKE